LGEKTVGERFSRGQYFTPRYQILEDTKYGCGNTSRQKNIIRKKQEQLILVGNVSGQNKNILLGGKIRGQYFTPF
jgi:hypothetical protein